MIWPICADYSDEHALEFSHVYADTYCTLDYHLNQSEFHPDSAAENNTSNFFKL